MYVILMLSVDVVPLKLNFCLHRDAQHNDWCFVVDWSVWNGVWSKFGVG